MKNWTLPIAMLMGIVLYFVYVNIPFLEPTKPYVEHAVAIVQPVLIFLMLFLTFCKVNVFGTASVPVASLALADSGRSFPVAGFADLALSGYSGSRAGGRRNALSDLPDGDGCCGCTRKLNGDAAHLTSYTILINLLVAFLVPLVVPSIHPHPGLGFGASFAADSGESVSFVAGTFIAAILLRYLSPGLHKRLGDISGFSFYLWAVA